MLRQVAEIRDPDKLIFHAPRGPVNQCPAANGVWWCCVEEPGGKGIVEMKWIVENEIVIKEYILHQEYNNHFYILGGSRISKITFETYVH